MPKNPVQSAPIANPEPARLTTTQNTTPDHVAGTAYYQQVKPRSNLEIHGKAIRRTPDEAKAILADAFARLNVGWDTLHEYHFVMLTQDDYDSYRGLRNLGEFYASYGLVNLHTARVTFENSIQSKTSTGLSIPVFVHESIFDSDEAIVQILYHEMYEIEELRYAIRSGVSTQAYWDMIRPDRFENLHYNAVRESDKIVIDYRELLSQGD